MKLHLRCLGLYSRICTMPTYIGIGILHIHEQRPIHASTSALHPHNKKFDDAHTNFTFTLISARFAKTDETSVKNFQSRRT